MKFSIICKRTGDLIVKNHSGLSFIREHIYTVSQIKPTCIAISKTVIVAGLVESGKIWTT